MKRLLCLIFGHRTPPGCTRARAICFSCHRCGELAPGDLSTR